MDGKPKNMIENKETLLFDLEETIRKLYDEKCIRFVSDHAYEAYSKNNHKYQYLGIFKSKEEAQKAVFDNKIHMFLSNIVENNENLADIKPCVVDGYFVSRNGNIYNRHGKQIYGRINRDGYICCTLHSKTYSLHRLIALSFILNPNLLPCINHKDGNKINNHADNLEWCTYSYNTLHAYRHGLEKRMRGEEHHSHKLSNDDVKYIRKVYKKRDSQYGAKPLADLFGVDRTTIRDIIRNKTWKEVI